MMQIARNWPTLARWLLALALALACGVSLAQSVRARIAEHAKTGYALTGMHAGARCEDCHQQGVFRGTPRDCASCHMRGARLAGSNTVMPAQHIASGASCESCHNTVRFAGAKFNHMGLTRDQCGSCHNGSVAPGKPNTPVHASVAGNCGDCHRSTVSWASASPDHGLFNASTNCASCHNAGSATGKPASHIPTSGNCGTCHTASSWKPASWNHTQQAVANQCSSCHNGTLASGRTANHIPNQSLTGVNIGNCDSCHRAGYASWAPGLFHRYFAMGNQCATCHLGGNYGQTAKPNTATHTGITANCENCHNSTSSWLSTSRPNHGQFTTATNCTSCHNGNNAAGKPATHIPTSANCMACHTVAAWKPSSWNHGQQAVANQCATCHNGTLASGRSANHIPNQSITGVSIGNCDSCHRAGFASWSPGYFHRYVTVGNQCATCHLSGSYGQTAKPNTATHTGITGSCENCHNSTASWASTTRPNHSTFTTATNCASCHNGSNASGKPAIHIPTTAGCMTCHTTSAWRPSRWNHTQQTVANQCSTCHNGTLASGKTANHIPNQAITGVPAGNCDSCHRAGYASWAPGYFHRYATVSNQCATCHLSGSYGQTAKPNTATHAGVTGSCENCHNSTASWLSTTRPNHSTYTTATNCSSCHNGSSASGKPALHIPTALNCMACHTTTAWRPSRWNHTQQAVANQCSTCHNGTLATGKLANHIPNQAITGVPAANCDGCHRAGYTSWTPGYYHRYVTVANQCATCHLSGSYGQTAKPATSTHTGITANCESCHRSTTSWATVSYAHAPQNAVGTGTCDTCHMGQANAVTKPASHIPVASATAKCDSCHRSQVSFATSVAMNHASVASALCKTCHNGAYTAAGTQGALAKPANHIPEAQLLNGASMDCKACHTSTTSWTTMTMNHNSSMGNGAGWCKSCHQTGTSYLGSMDRKSLTHRSGTQVKTDCSQSGCHRPLGSTGTTFSRWM